MEESNIRIIQVDKGQSPCRLDMYIVNRMEHVTRNKIQKAIKDGRITLDDKPTKSNYKLRGGEVIKLEMPSSANQTDHIIPQDIPIDIVYEDDHLLVVNKVAGMVVHPGISNADGTLVNAIAHYLNTDTGPVLPDNPPNRPGLVHRIDKDTSGLLVVAKDEHTLSHLAKQFFDHSIERTYLALVWGSPEPTSGTIDEFVGRHHRNRVVMTVFPDRDEGKHAITHYEMEEDFYYVSLLRCTLETGRTHQIRAHFQHLGHPLFNDESYGGTRIMKGTVFSKYKSFVEKNFTFLKGQALHAATLSFVHPHTEKQMRFEQEPPEGFTKVLERWRVYINDRKNKND